MSGLWTCYGFCGGLPVSTRPGAPKGKAMMRTLKTGEAKYLLRSAQGKNRSLMRDGLNARDMPVVSASNIIARAKDRRGPEG